MQFKLAVEKAGGAQLDRLIQEHQKKMQSVRTGFGPGRSNPVSGEKAERESVSRSSEPSSARKPVRGYKLKPKEQTAEKTSISSSGLQWTILCAVILLIGVFSWGAFRRKD